jgi:hypothetical protein
MWEPFAHFCTVLLAALVVALLIGLFAKWHIGNRQKKESPRNLDKDHHDTVMEIIEEKNKHATVERETDKVDHTVMNYLQTNAAVLVVGGDLVDRKNSGTSYLGKIVTHSRGGGLTTVLDRGRGHYALGASFSVGSDITLAKFERGRLTYRPAFDIYAVLLHAGDDAAIFFRARDVNCVMPILASHDCTDAWLSMSRAAVTACLQLHVGTLDGVVSRQVPTLPDLIPRFAGVIVHNYSIIAVKCIAPAKNNSDAIFVTINDDYGRKGIDRATITPALLLTDVEKFACGHVARHPIDGYYVLHLFRDDSDSLAIIFDEVHSDCISLIVEAFQVKMDVEYPTAWHDWEKAFEDVRSKT